jgi:hypothetical protein
VEVATIDERHLDRRSAQATDGLQTAEAPAHDDHPVGFFASAHVPRFAVRRPGRGCRACARSPDRTSARRRRPPRVVRESGVRHGPGPARSGPIGLGELVAVGVQRRTRLGGVHDDDRAGGVVDALVADGAEQEPGKPAVTAGAHHQQITLGD